MKLGMNMWWRRRRNGYNCIIKPTSNNIKIFMA
jgi:hypothetical protein